MSSLGNGAKIKNYNFIFLCFPTHHLMCSNGFFIFFFETFAFLLRLTASVINQDSFSVNKRGYDLVVCPFHNDHEKELSQMSQFSQQVTVLSVSFLPAVSNYRMCSLLSIFLLLGLCDSHSNIMINVEQSLWKFHYWTFLK